MIRLAMLSIAFAMLGALPGAARADDPAPVREENRRKIDPPAYEMRTREEHEEIETAALMAAEMLDRDLAEDLWKIAAPQLRQTTRREQLMDMSTVRKRFGLNTSRRVLLSTFVPGDLPWMPPGRYAVVIYCSRFGKIAFEESVTLASDADGRWALAGIDLIVSPGVSAPADDPGEPACASVEGQRADHGAAADTAAHAIARSGADGSHALRSAAPPAI
jgi:hypothetical protein